MCAVHSPMPRTSDELAHDHVVGEPVHAVELDEAGVDLLREIEDRRGLAAREPDAAQLLHRQREHRFGCRRRRRTARRSGRGSRPRPGPRAAGNRSTRASSAKCVRRGRRPLQLGHAVRLQRERAAPDRAARARARPPRPSREPSPSASVCAGTRARRRASIDEPDRVADRGRVAIGHADAQRHAAGVDGELGAVAREHALHDRARAPARRRRAAPRRAAARPAPRLAAATGASTGSTPHGVRKPSAPIGRVDRRAEAEEVGGPLVGRVPPHVGGRARLARRGPRASPTTRSASANASS